MINTILTYDSLDSELGDFFASCAEKIIAATSADYNLVDIHGRQLNEAAIQITGNGMGQNPFLFISYSHGSDTELLRNGETPILSLAKDIGWLKGSSAFCFACYSGKELGPALIRNGAISFVGYNSQIKIQKYFCALESFIECAVSVVKYFLSGLKLQDSFNKSKEDYTKCVDHFYTIDVVVATFFIEDRDAMVLLGKKNISIREFYC